MVKIQIDFLFHMFQAILNIDYLKCIKLSWEGVGQTRMTAGGIKSQKYQKFREKIPYMLYVMDYGDHILSST